MKKVFAILAVAGLMTACNNAAAPEVKADSTAVSADTAVAVPQNDTNDYKAINAEKLSTEKVK